MGKPTYIYSVRAWNNKSNELEIDEFFLAKNKRTLLKYVQNIYKEYKYSKYEITQIGISENNEPMQRINEFDSKKLRQAKELRDQYYMSRYSIEPVKSKGVEF